MIMAQYLSCALKHGWYLVEEMGLEKTAFSWAEGVVGVIREVSLIISSRGYGTCSLLLAFYWLASRLFQSSNIEMPTIVQH